MKDSVLLQIKEIAMRYNLKKIMLFGSRARGDGTAVSDYDIAIYAEELSEQEKAIIYDEIQDINTLKKIDILFVNAGKSDEFLKSIEKEGVIIHE